MAVKTSWSAGEVLQAQDLTDTFAAKFDSAPAQNTQTGTGASAYTFVLADADRLTVANAASAATYTVPPQASVAWGTGDILRVVSTGAGVITFAGGSGVTVTNTAATLAQYQSAALVRTGSNAWTVVPFSGGASKATVSGTTGSPTIATVGSRTVYTFTGNGSITIGSAGTAEILVVGGGGGAGLYDVTGGGGGAGGYLTRVLNLASGTYNVVIGSGGAGTGYGSGGQGGRSYLQGVLYAEGGGGGGGNTSIGQNPSPGASGAGTRYGGTNSIGIPGQGFDGSTAVNGGGGGAGGAGSGSTGGPGIANSITGSSITYAVGGNGTGGTAGTNGRGNGGSGGGAAGGSGVIIVAIG